MTTFSPFAWPLICEWRQHKVSFAWSSIRSLCFIWKMNLFRIMWTLSVITLASIAKLTHAWVILSSLHHVGSTKDRRWCSAYFFFWNTFIIQHSMQKEVILWTSKTEWPKKILRNYWPWMFTDKGCTFFTVVLSITLSHPTDKSCLSIAKKRG